MRLNRVYYNEMDPRMCAWLRQLISDGHLPDGYVDCRPIEHVTPKELEHYEQCHFFAGIGGWPLALALAGWEGPVWTGSCPCQPFSVAGKGKGEDDPRHVWPAFRARIAERRPSVIFGEQVAGAAGRLWLAGVRDDLEKLGYAIGAADLCAAGVSAPHIRQRLYWVADASGERRDRKQTATKPTGRTLTKIMSGGMEHANDTASSRFRFICLPLEPKQETGRPCYSDTWSDFGIIECADRKARRIEPGSSPLVDGVPGRVGLLRGYGNAIVPQLAAEFVAAYVEARHLI